MKMVHRMDGSWCVSVNRTTSIGLAVMMAAVMVAVMVQTASADDGANFFLKASKSVPRIGRRSDFFLKTQKSVPRIGRRRTMAPLTEGRELGVGSSWPWYRTGDSMPGPSKRAHEDYYIQKDGQPLHWADIDRALEESPDMWVPQMWKTIDEDDDTEWPRMRRAAELEETRSQAEV